MLKAPSEEGLVLLRMLPLKRKTKTRTIANMTAHFLRMFQRDLMGVWIRWAAVAVER